MRVADRQVDRADTPDGLPQSPGARGEQSCGGVLLHLASPRHAEEATLTGSQIAKANSSNATANRRFTGSSTASS
jgi:hypothetical protein